MKNMLNLAQGKRLLSSSFSLFSPNFPLFCQVNPNFPLVVLWNFNNLRAKPRKNKSRESRFFQESREGAGVLGNLAPNPRPLPKRALGGFRFSGRHHRMFSDFPQCLCAAFPPVDAAPRGVA
jgi:hypothetical protein